MIKRDCLDHLLEAATKYPIVAITGPRQSGKTTLAKAAFPHKPYVNLELLDNRNLAKEDPIKFLTFYENGAILDEIQHVPELFSYLQVRVDANDVVGEFIISGSQNFLLMESITQSLAGRVAIFDLLPLSFHELKTHNPEISLQEIVTCGGYPRMYKKNIEKTGFFRDYIQTYVERDVRTLKQVSDLDTFQRFILGCAARCGQLLNLSSLAMECGISANTAKSWLSILKTSYIIFTLQPYFENFNKRLVKQPKLYFYDTGLVCSLLNITEDFSTSYFKGALFENFIILEIIKKRWAMRKKTNLYFWRDNEGHEIDLVSQQDGILTGIEIKASHTVSMDFFKNLNYLEKFNSGLKKMVVYAGQENLPGNIISWCKIWDSFS